MQRTFWFGCFLLFGALPAAGQSNTDQFIASLDAHMADLTEDGFSGVVLVAFDGETVYRKGFGYADCAGQIPMTPDHLLLIGSITKDIVQLLTYRLAEEGHLTLDDAIGQYFPSFPPELAGLTIQQLVNHTSGLPDIINEKGKRTPYTVAFDYKPVSRAQLIEKASRSKLRFDPGTDERYSNLGYGLLAAILEIASGESLEALLESRIFEPAGMETMAFTFPDQPSLLFADGCRRNGNRWGSPYKDGMWGDEGASWNLKGAGGLIGRADDLAAFFGGIQDGVYFETDMQDAFLNNRLSYLGSWEERGMGPAGSNGIFNAVAFWAETSDLRVVILSNYARHPAEAHSRDIIRMAKPFR